MKRTNKNIIYKEDTEQLAIFAKALGHPTRIKIIKQLSKQNHFHTTELLDIIPLAQSTVSQLLKEIKNAGLIIGEIIPPKVKYCINKENWEKAKKRSCIFFDINFNENSFNI